ncbi:low temperature requirement protein A [Arthrobacter bambusae]|nr:low temperature requirement protein A [Arthrobacter bambusae]MCI0142583.1 low temperature requirement protein A [Arthrobacter bambusae]
MDGTSPAPARGRRWPAGAHAGEVATAFELFFDLVFVFAATPVTGLMMHEHGVIGILHGLILLGMLWWTWCAFTWLGNQVRADAGIGMVGFGLATVGVFVVALSIPTAWEHADSGLPGPAVLVCAYLFVRVVYTIAAQGDQGLRRQIAISWLPRVHGRAADSRGCHRWRRADDPVHRSGPRRVAVHLPHVLAGQLENSQPLPLDGAV